MKTRIYRPTPHNIRNLALALRRGELVAVPTETVYGLAADALNESACKAIFTAKDRPTHDPLIVHVHSLTQAKSLTVWNNMAEKLAKAFWPGALTLILPKSPTVSDLVTSGLPSVAVRMPSHPVFRQLLRKTNRPLAAPSANPFGYISPTSSSHVKDGLNGRIPAILDGGPCQIGLESTILDIRNPNRPQILRPGGINRAEIEAKLGLKLSHPRAVVKSTQAALAPGMLERHYSPHTPVVLHQKLPTTLPADLAVVYFAPNSSPAGSGAKNHFILAPDGTGGSAARHLFALMRKLDQGQWRQIHIELPPPSDPWFSAIVDRLSRASASSR